MERTTKCTQQRCQYRDRSVQHQLRTDGTFGIRVYSARNHETRRASESSVVGPHVENMETDDHIGVISVEEAGVPYAPDATSRRTTPPRPYLGPTKRRIVEKHEVQGGFQTSPPLHEKGLDKTGARAKGQDNRSQSSSY